MDLFYILLVLLVVTRFFGELALRFNQAVLVGELLAGVALGLVVQSFSGTFPVLADLPSNEVFRAITDLAVYFLMLLAGVEMRPRDLYRASGQAFWVATGGMIVPLALGLGIGLLMLPASPVRPAQSLFLAVSLSITAVPVTFATLMELGLEDTSTGRLIVSAAVFDDLISLFLLAVLTAFVGGAAITITSVGWLTAKMLLFLVVIFIARLLFPWTGRVIARLQIPHSEFSLLMAWALALSVVAGALGMHFILGAYGAGLFFTRRTISEEVHDEMFRTLETVTLGFFAPIFFASIGLSMRADAITGAPVFLGLLLSAAFLGKLTGAGLAALWTGRSRRAALAVGVGMNARGAVELIVAGIALEAGLFDRPSPAPPVVANMFSAVVIVAIVTTVVSPLVLKRMLRGHEPLD